MGSSVTLAEAKSSSVKMSSLIGHNPVQEKPFITLSGVADCRYALEKIPAISYWDIRLPGLAVIQLSATALYALFSGLKKVLSNGWSLWVQ